MVAVSCCPKSGPLWVRNQARLSKVGWISSFQLSHLAGERQGDLGVDILHGRRGFERLIQPIE